MHFVIPNIDKEESVLENETNKIIWDIVIQTNHLILARRLILLLIAKKKKKKKKKKKRKENFSSRGFCCPN